MPATGSANGATVVIVNGDAALAHALKFRFELEGFDVHVHDDARALLALGMVPDEACLVIDQDMLDIDALQTVVRTRASGLKAPVVLIATNPTASLRARAEAIGVSIVEKPLLDDVLLTAVRRALIHALV